MTKFNQGKEKLNDLLSFQKLSHNHFGIGYIEKSSYVSNPLFLLWKESLIMFQKELRQSLYGFLRI